MDEIRTHVGIDEALCGTPVALTEGRAEVELRTSGAMAADRRGLVHGGFVFGAADYAAMLAVNDPCVVLGAAESRFTAPVEVGETVLLRAERTACSGRKHVVTVSGAVGERVVFEGTFTTFVLDGHVLDR
ncbi:MAG: thioesterase [Deltaproteobacteria bacterium]|nr:MAG: thioesterase [Deltaproteobacteria bacterium]